MRIALVTETFFPAVDGPLEPVGAQVRAAVPRADRVLVTSSWMVQRAAELGVHADLSGVRLVVIGDGPQRTWLTHHLPARDLQPRAARGGARAGSRSWRTDAVDELVATMTQAAAGTLSDSRSGGRGRR
jgi:hypothetical protein